MTPCDGTPNSETWCCGLDNTACCGTPDAITLAAFGATSTTTTTTTTASTSISALATGSPVISNEPEIKYSAGTGLSDGAKASISVDAAVGGIAVIAALAFLFVRRRRQSKTGGVNMAGVEPAAGLVYQGYTAVQNPGGMAHEKSAGVEDTRHELPGESARRTC